LVRPGCHSQNQQGWRWLWSAPTKIPTSDVDTSRLPKNAAYPVSGGDNMGATYRPQKCVSGDTGAVAQPYPWLLRLYQSFKAVTEHPGAP
jgi:hypothetical protein